MDRLKNYAVSHGVKVTAALGLNEGNFFDARHIVDEFVEMVAALPVDVPAAGDTVVSPELRLAVVLYWSRSAALKVAAAKCDNGSSHG